MLVPGAALEQSPFSVHALNFLGVFDEAEMDLWEGGTVGIQGEQPEAPHGLGAVPSPVLGHWFSPGCHSPLQPHTRRDLSRKAFPGGKGVSMRLSRLGCPTCATWRPQSPPGHPSAALSCWQS